MQDITQSGPPSASTACIDEEGYATIADIQVLYSHHECEATTICLPPPSDTKQDDIRDIECYSTSSVPLPTAKVHQQENTQLTLSHDGVLTAIPTVTNECYSTSRLPPPTLPRVHQQQDMQLTQNQAYVTPADIQLTSKGGYGTPCMAL